QDVYNAAGS
ncbi:hypothetical protein PF006_g26532, partial [Phytophthora fragariae]